MIDSTSSSSDSDGTYANIAGLMNHKKPMVSELFWGKVDKIMKQYHSWDFDSVDSKVIKGLVQRKFKSDDSLSDSEEDEMPENSDKEGKFHFDDYKGTTNYNSSIQRSDNYKVFDFSN